MNKKKYFVKRSDEVKINRLRLGHSKLTHEYLFGDYNQFPHVICMMMEYLQLNIFLVECVRLNHVRRRVLFSDARVNYMSLGDLLGDKIQVRRIVQYLKEINIYDSI